MADKDKAIKKSDEHSEKENKSSVQNDEPDVIIDIPVLKAKEINMDAENINFSISVKAQLSNLTNVEIGTTIHIKKLKLDVNSLEAEALIHVKLKKIEAIFLKAIESLDKHPQVLKHAKNNHNSK